jgi:cysteine desulfurase / selenocysteine lyase
MSALKPLPAIIDKTALRAQFPILSRQAYGKPLVYLDNAATSQKPLAVIRAIEDYYTRYNANVHRGVHLLSQEATEAMEAVRTTVRDFIGAASEREVIFTAGTTDAINLVAQSWGEQHIAAGDNLIVTEMEHHANIVPWQMLAERKGAQIRLLPIDDAGQLQWGQLDQIADSRTKLLAVTHVSNALGTVNPICDIVSRAKSMGLTVLVDGAQAVPHMQVDVRTIGCDFYVFSGHKMFAPTGIGVLWGREELLSAMPPWRGGGEMIETVSLRTGTTYNVLPFKFEAGTPHVEGIIGLGAAIGFVREQGIANIHREEEHLLAYATERLMAIPGAIIHGTAPVKSAVLSFNFKGIHPYDLGTLLDKQGIAIRTGHHCAQPIMERYGISGTARASFAFYNTTEEIDRFIAATERAVGMLG